MPDSFDCQDRAEVFQKNEKNDEKKIPASEVHQIPLISLFIFELL